MNRSSQAKKLVKRIDDLDKDLNGELAKFEKTIKSDAVRKEFDVAKSAIAAYKSIQNEVVKLGLAGQSDKATATLRSDTAVKATEDANKASKA